MARSFLNFTSLDDNTAKKELQRFRDIVLRGEYDRQERVEDDATANAMWRNELWSQEDLEFFDALDISPYKFPVFRPLVNNLISRQRNRRITFGFVPTDPQSFRRQREGRERFVQEQLSKEFPRFDSRKEAEDFYDKYYDDKKAEAVSALLHNVRDTNKAKYTESETFQQGLISGLDFFKCSYGKKIDQNGGIQIERRPQRAVFYDETSVDYGLKDVEYIGEVQKLYKSQIITQYPDYKEDIEEFFQEYTRLDHRGNYNTTPNENWEYFYEFNYQNREESQLRIAELWFLDTEERFYVHNTKTGEDRLVDYGITEDEIVDNLMSKIVLELEKSEKPEDKELLQSPNVKQEIASIVEERFEVNTTQEPVWKKAVFSYNCLFELERSPLPHDSHPYYPFFAQFSEGEFMGLMDDIQDIVMAINKALAFRELMMAHGSKGLVIVDEDIFARSGYDLDTVAEHWTSIGGVLALKLKPREQIADAIDSITTVGEGLDAINNILADLDNRLYQISGVNLAQLGIVQRETTSSGYRQQVAEGESTNGLLFDNFLRSLENFYNDKVVPLVVWMMNNTEQKAIRIVGDEFKPWIEIDDDESESFFEEAIRNGQYSTTLKAKKDNAQIQEERSARYMEMAMGGMLDPEIAIEFSTDPDRYKLLQRMKEKELERARRQAYNQFSMEEFYKAASQSDLPAEALEDMIEKMKKEKMKQQAQEGEEMRGSQLSAGEVKQRQQGAKGQTSPTIRQQGQEPQRLKNIEQSAGEQQQ